LQLTMTRCDVGDRGLLEHGPHRVLDTHPELLHAALMRLHAAFVVRLQAVHGREWPFERVDHFGDPDLARIARECSAAVCTALRIDDARLMQRGELVLEETQRYALRGRDRARRNRTVAVPRGELDQCADAVLGAECELHGTSENGVLPGKMVAAGPVAVNGRPRRQG